MPVTPRDILGGPDWLWRDFYDVTVKLPEGLTREQRGNAADDFTALQKQLGMKLQRGGKKSTPVFIVESVERPSEN